MFRQIAHDAVTPSATAGNDSQVASLQQLRRDLEAYQLTVEAQRGEIDRALTQLVRLRQVSLQLLERLHAEGATVTTTGEICQCSRALAERLGSSAIQLRGKSFLDYLSRSEGNQFLTLCRECIKGHRDVTFDSQLMIDKRSPHKVRMILMEAPGWSLADQDTVPESLLIISDCKTGFADSVANAIRSDSDERSMQPEHHDTIPVPPSDTVAGLENRIQTGESIGWFAGGIAHDFNNVLTAINCNISMALAEVSPDGAAVPFLRDALGSVAQASGLTRQLLEFSRRQPTVPELSRVDLLIDAVRGTIEHGAGDRISIRTTLQADSGVIRVDPRQFEMVLVTLVRNARDAMPGGGMLLIDISNVAIVHKYSSSRPPLSPGSYVAMRVIDHGCGIRQEVVGRLFEPFYTTKSRDQGIGLGLATSLVAVRQAGGGIEVNSSLGMGTTVTVYWPRVLDVDHAPMTVRVRAMPDSGPVTILLVEDDAELRSLGTRILGRLGYRVLRAANGIEALEVATRHQGRIDLLFTDIVMPGINGRDLAMRLRRFRPDLKVLFTSGYSEGTVEEVPGGGAKQEEPDAYSEAYLSKPYLPEALASRVDEILRSERTSLAGGATESQELTP